MARLVLLLGGAALLVLLLWRLGPAHIFETLARIGWYFAASLLLGAAHHAIRAVALHRCVIRSGVVGYREALAIRLSGEAIQSLTLTGPVLAEPTKAWLLETRGLTLREGFAATLTEYLIYTFVTAAMSMAGLAYLIAAFDAAETIRRIAIAIIGMCAAFLLASAVAIGRRIYLIGTIIDGLARAGVLRGRLTPNITWINRMEDLLLAILRDSPRRFAAVAALEAAAQAMLVFELFLLLHAFGVFASSWSALAIESSVKFFEFAFIFVPLQLGVSEGTYTLIFGVMGLPLAAGFAVAFVRRARTLVIASVGLGMLALLTRSPHWRRGGTRSSAS